MPTVFRRDEFVRSVQGQSVSGAQVFVCTQPANAASYPPSPLATVYSDAAGTIPITQPIITDGFGHCAFYVPVGTYTIVVANNDVIQQVYTDQLIGQTGAGSIEFATNDIPNIDQSVLNLKDGNFITLTADGVGGVVVDTSSDVVDVTSQYVFLIADSVTDNLATINAALAALPVTGGTINFVALGTGHCYVSDTVTISKPSTVFRGSGAPVNDGFGALNVFRGSCVLQFAAGKSGIIVNAAESVLIENIGVLSKDSGAASGDNGIWIKGFSSGSVTVRNCGISSFGGVGLLIDSSGGGNCDHWRVDQVICWENFGDGFKIFGGVDGNAGTAINLNCTENGGWGINIDSGSVSNMFLSSHVSGNTGGGTRCNQTSNTFMNHYTEGSPAPTSTFVLDTNANNCQVWFHTYAQPGSITNNAPTNLIYYQDPNTNYPGFTGFAINTQAFSGGRTYRIQNGSFNGNDLSIADDLGQTWLDFNQGLNALLSLQTLACANTTGATSSGSTNSAILEFYSQFWDPDLDAGTVDTSGTAVTWDSGTVFNVGMVGGTIVINGVNYTVSAFTDNHHITLSGTAGTQSGVAYTFAGTSTDLWAIKTVGGSGSDGTSTLTLTHTGSAGDAVINIVGSVTGFGNGSAGTAVTTTTKSTGTGPTTPQTVVNYLKLEVGGVAYWVPLVQ